jgi:hypothetical protein
VSTSPSRRWSRQASSSGRHPVEPLYARLREHYDEPMLIEMTQLIGWYTIVAMQVALASLRLPI